MHVNGQDDRSVPERPLEGLQENVPLAPLTTIGIGGPARYFLEVHTVVDLERAMAWARRHEIPLFILGGGSNLLISDRGFDGLVIRIMLRGISVESDDPQVMVEAAAGEEWDPFVAMAVENGWAGLECLSGIPGFIGATPIQNVGAYGQEVSETIVRVEAMDRLTGIVRSFTNEECRFSYRDSIFKHEERDRHIILSVTYRLLPGGEPAVRYPELARTLDARGGERSLAAVRETVIDIRKRKAMVIDPADPDTKSDGSFFMNPVISRDELEAFHAAARRSGIEDIERIPLFPAANDQVKLSAAWLIEQAGFARGFKRGNAGISSKHTLAIINRGGATADEVLELVRLIQQKVEEKFGIRLVPEPNFVGVQ